jgi:hypothetical protein
MYLSCHRSSASNTASSLLVAHVLMRMDQLTPSGVTIHQAGHPHVGLGHEMEKYSKIVFSRLSRKGCVKPGGPTQHDQWASSSLLEAVDAWKDNACACTSHLRRLLSADPVRLGAATHPSSSSSSEPT